MIKKILFLLIISSVSLAVFGQNFNMSNNTVNLDCATGGNLFPDNGAGNNYSQGQNLVFTVCPSNTSTDVVEFSFNSGFFGTNDFLCVYDGTTTTAVLIDCYDITSGINTQDVIRAGINNASGCLTFQFSSDADGSTGTFSIDLSCAPACQRLNAEILNSNPMFNSDTTYIDICNGNNLTITGTADYYENNTTYTQSDATSNFFWSIGSDSLFGQTINVQFIDSGFYPILLTVEDNNGCRSINELNLKVRYAPKAKFDYQGDSVLCLRDTSRLFDIAKGEIDATGNIVNGDTMRQQSAFSVSGDTTYIPDDADGISGNGNSTPAIFDIYVSGYQPGATITDANQVINVCLDIEHSYIGDIDIILVAPDGTQIYLMDMNPPAGPGSDFGIPIVGVGTGVGTPFTYCWNMAATMPAIVSGSVQPGTIPDSSQIQPADSYTGLVGVPVNGHWQIQVLDDYGGDDGYIFGATFEFAPELQASPDSFYMTYSAQGFWDPNPNFISNPNQNEVFVIPDTPGIHTFYYNTTNNFGCVERDTVHLLVEGFDVIANPQDTTICEGESVQLNATVDGETITCETDYLVYEIPYNKEEGTLIPFNFSNTNNGASQAITMPFPFRFYCANSTSVRAYTDGYISFLNTGASIPNNAPFPTAVMPNSLIALMWDDLVDSASASGYFVSGTAPNRKMVIDFDLVHNGGTPSTEPVKGQIILYETTNMIDILCENCQQDADDPTASQGMENFTGAYGSFTPGRNGGAWSATNSAWRYYPQSSLNTDYTVFWTPNATLVGDSTQAPFATPIATTDYVVDIKRNDNSCNYKDTVTVNVIPHFTYNFANDTSICAGQSVQLNVTGNATNIAWTPNNGTINDTTIFNPTITPDTSSAYYALLDSAGFCPTLDTVNINFIEQVIVDTTIVTNPPCNGAASIEIILDTASSPAQFSIDGGTTFTTDSFFNNLAPGVYDIVVGGGGSCDTSYQVTINASAPAIIIDSIVTTDLSCNNSSDGTITVYAQGGSGTLTFSVDSGTIYQAGNQFNNLDSGYYNIFVQDSLLCTTDSSATLNAPNAINISLVSNDSLDCYGDTDGIISVTASGGAGSYTYSIDNIIFGTDSFFTNLSQGTYTIYVQDANMCIDSLQNIPIEQPDSLFITNITVQNVACFGDTAGSLISFDAQGGTAPYQYAIDGTYGTNNVFQNMTAGNYQLNITDANGCTAIPIDTVITEPTLLEFVLDSTQNATCGLNNGSIYVSGSGGTSPYFYAIDGGANQTTGTFQNLALGNYTITITDAYGCDTTEIITLNGYPAVNISLVNVDSTSCYGLSDGLIEVQGLNGTTPYEFSIDSGNTYQSSGLFTNLQGGDYMLLVSDSIGCTDTLYQTIEQPDSLGLTAVVDSITCYGVADGVITLSNTGGNPTYTYSITNDAALQANNVFNNLDIGLYTAYVVDAKNCRDSVDINVYQPDSLSFTNITATDILCNGDDNGSFTVVVAGGTPAYQYSIDNITFQSSNVLSGLDGGVYTIYVRDANNCTKSIVDSIFEPTLLTLDTLSTTNITCNSGNDGNIILTANGGTSPYEYSVDGTNFQSNATFSSLNAGNYTLTVRDANQCTETVNVTLTEPQPLTVVIDSTNILCFGDTDGSITVTSVAGETAPYTISFNGGAYQAYTTGMTFNNLSAGLYNISIQDANNCPSPAFSRDVNIVVPSLFEIDTVTTTNPLCFGDANGNISIYTNGGGVAPYSYNIVEGGDTYTNTSGVFNNLSEGDYAIWVSDANGCTSQTVGTLVSPPELFLNVDSVINPSCFGYDNGYIFINASGGIPAQGSTPYIYTLADGTQAINNIFTSLPEGIYSVTATDANNCSTTIQVVVEDPSPVFVSISPEDTLIEMGETVNLSVNIDSAAGTNFIYVWNPSNGLSCTDCQNPIVNIYQDEEFTLTFYDENGCMDIATATVRINDTLHYFIPNAFTPSGFDNTNATFKVYGQDIKYVDMMIFNRWGEKIYESINALSEWDGTYQGTLQNPGVYTYYVKITFLNDATKEHKGSVTLLR